jgi:tellurite resistance protein
VRPGRRIPPNLFGAPFGLAGLAEAWTVAAKDLGTPQGVADAISIVAAVAWVVIVVAYLRQGWRTVVADARDRVTTPFGPLALITPMLLGAALFPSAALAGRVIVVVFLIATVLAGGLLTGQWIVAGLHPADVHPGYFLPTAAGGFIAASAAAEVGLRPVAEAAFGLGLVCWVLLGSIILNRLLVQPELPAAVRLTLAIELAPPAVGGIAYLALSGPILGTYILGGYTVLMTLVQVRLIPVYARLRFGLTFWTFTFAYASAATYALEWLGLKHPAGQRAYGGVVLALVTGFIAIIAIRSLIQLARGQFLPARDPSPGR